MKISKRKMFFTSLCPKKKLHKKSKYQVFPNKKKNQMWSFKVSTNFGFFDLISLLSNQH